MTWTGVSLSASARRRNRPGHRTRALISILVGMRALLIFSFVTVVSVVVGYFLSTYSHGETTDQLACPVLLLGLVTITLMVNLPQSVL